MTFNSVMTELADRRYHWQQAREVGKILTAVQNGENRRLSSAEYRTCDEYASDVLGSKKYAPWLYAYTLLRGKFFEGWIPDNYYATEVIRKTKGRYKDLSQFRSLNRAYFGSELFPDLVSYVNERYFANDGTALLPEEVSGYLFQNHDQVVFKQDRSRQGQGIHIIRKGQFDLSKIENLGDGIFQSFVLPHPAVSPFPTKAVATIRITTYMNQIGEVKIPAAYLRIGSPTDEVVRSRTARVAAIDLSDGSVGEYGFAKNWVRQESYPETSLRFDEIKVPNFQQACRAVRELHLKIPQVNCIGWDLTVDLQGDIKILEWNSGHNDIKFGEATQGPGFKSLGWENLWRENRAR